MERILSSVVDRIYELLKKHKKEDGTPDPWKPINLAKACGKNGTWINKRIGRGPKTPKVILNIEDVELIAGALKVDIAELFPGSLWHDIKSMSLYDFLNKLISENVEKYCSEIKGGESCEGGQS